MIFNTLAVIENTVEGGGANTSDATITSGSQLLSGVTAYGPNGKIEGTLVVQSYYTSNVAPSASLGIDGDLCLVRAGE